MTTRTYEIADAIMDEAEYEYREFNLANIQSVQNYAFNGMDIVISDEEAEAILTACRAFIEYVKTHSTVRYDESWAIEQWEEMVRRPLLSWGEEEDE